MRRWMLLLGAMVAITSLAVACGSDKKTIKTDDGKITVGGDLPDSFPDDFPVYPGADYQSGIESSQGGVDGFAATWTSGDDFSKVRDFYDDELKDGDWVASSSGNTGSDGAFWLAENTSKKLTAYVIVGNTDGDTSITAIVGDSDDLSSGGDDPTEPADSSDDDTPTSSDTGGDLPDEVDLDDDFPKEEVYIPSGARVTSTSSLNSNGTSSYFVELYVKGDADKIADDFAEGMKDKGWTDSFNSTTNGEVFQSYSRGADATTDAVTVAITKSDVSGYVTINMSASITGE